MEAKMLLSKSEPMTDKIPFTGRSRSRSPFAVLPFSNSPSQSYIFLHHVGTEIFL